MKVAALLDDPAEALIVEQTLSLAGHACARYRDGKALTQALRREAFHMLLLDWEAPGVTARDVLLWVRRNVGDRLPVMVLSRGTGDTHIAACFTDGGDAYMGKPVRRDELAARIHALARRAIPSPDARFDVVLGAYRFSTADRRAYLNGKLIAMAPKEFDLAILLFRHAGELLLRKTLADEVWHRRVPDTSRTIDSHLSRVRTKLALWPHNGVQLCTVYAVGSRLDVVEPR
jgi:DNA-binding response OmpR family regulator